MASRAKSSQWESRILQWVIRSSQSEPWDPGIFSLRVAKIETRLCKGQKGTQSEKNAPLAAYKATHTKKWVAL